MYSKLPFDCLYCGMLIIGNRDVLMKIIVMSKFIQSLRPTRHGYEFLV